MGIEIVLFALSGIGILFASVESGKAWGHFAGFGVFMVGVGLCAALFLAPLYFQPIPYWPAIPTALAFIVHRYAQAQKFAKIADADNDDI